MIGHEATEERKNTKKVQWTHSSGESILANISKRKHGSIPNFNKTGAAISRFNK